MSSLMNFDPNAYLEMSIDVPMEKRPPVPAAVFFPGSITAIKFEPWRSKEKVDESTGQLKEGIRLDVTIEIQIPADAKQQYGLTYDKLTVTDGVMIDRNSSGGIDTTPGKNNRLRLYREATDLNRPGEVFKPVMLVGRSVSVKFRHEDYQGNIQERIDTVVRP